MGKSLDIEDLTKCISCNEIIEKKDVFCKYCGWRNKCEKCGKNTLEKKNDHGTDYNRCKSCGHCGDYNY